MSTPSDGENIKICVQHAVTGERLAEAVFPATATVDDLRAAAAASLELLPLLTFRLLHGGRLLEDGAATLAAAGLTDGAQVDVVRCRCQALAAACEDGVAEVWNLETG
eukprot:gb/GFBE01058502.1/.p1 GENE.gb/GFBE01058502.1/~~gb/GFBE01058502.1/.p1  ORF type:complete len:108 (+),score=20.08 gb/GFBE01058502.1/:1-324(+)